MKTIVTYKSKYGSAKQYAEWLAEELNCEAVDLSKIKKEKLAEYDTIIHGGGLYAGGLAGLSYYKKNSDIIKGKKFIVYATGAAPSYNEEMIKELKKKNLEGLPTETEFFYCAGNYSYPKMTVGHKMMMKMMDNLLKKQIKENGKVDEWAEGFQDIIFSEFRHVDKKFLAPIVGAVQ